MQLRLLEIVRQVAAMDLQQAQVVGDFLWVDDRPATIRVRDASSIVLRPKPRGDFRRCVLAALGMW